MSAVADDFAGCRCRDEYGSGAVGATFSPGGGPLLTSLLKAGVAVGSGLLSTLVLAMLFKALTAMLALVGAVSASWFPSGFVLGCVLAFTSLFTYAVLRLFGEPPEVPRAEAFGTIDLRPAEPVPPKNAEPLLA